MLILTRKPGESLYIGHVKVTIVEIKGHQIRIGIDAPKDIRIYREEIYLQILEENKKAAEVVMDKDLTGLSESWGQRGGGASALSSLKTQTTAKSPAAAPGAFSESANPGSIEVRKRRSKKDS